MAPALVGSEGSVVTGATPVVALLPQTPTAGNILVAMVVADDGTNQGVNTSTSGWAAAVNQNGNTGDASVWYKIAAGGDVAPTFTSALSGFLAVKVNEYSGVAASSPVDKVGSQFNNVGTPMVTPTSAADAATGALVVLASTLSHFWGATITTTNTLNNGATPTRAAPNDSSSVLT